MAAAFDAVTTQAGTAASFNHTPSGSPTLAVFTAHWDGGDTTSDLTAVTYGGQAMTQKAFIDHQGNANGPTTSHVAEIWTLENPPTGTQAVVITRAGTACTRQAYALSTYTGTGAVGTASTTSDNTNTLTTASIAGISSATGGIVIDALTTQEAEDHTADAGQTERWDLSHSTNHRGCGSTEAGAASVTVGWSWTTATRFAYAAIPVAGAVAAAVTVPVGSLVLTGKAPTPVVGTVPLAPAAPSSVETTTTGDSITMTWTDNTSGAAQHRCYIKRATDSVWDLGGDTELAETSYTFNWLSQSTEYDVAVSAFDADAESNIVQPAEIPEPTGTVRLVSGSFL